MRDLKPEIDKLKKKYKDKTKLQQAQMELFQKHQVNPASGCLPQIVQFIFLIALYRVFIDFLNNGSANIQGITFLWLNLNEPDPTYVLPIITGISQLILGFMILPATDTSAEKAIAATTPDKKDDAKAQDMAEMASTMQQQMVYVMPFMTAILATRFPSGLALYWVISTVFSAVQQYLISGPGGLAYYTNRLTSRLLPSKR
jgi:YidC/Oxa1 family membrane protein insertase